MPEKKTWKRFVIFTPDQTPTGWAMGTLADHAIRNWLYDVEGKMRPEEVERRWEAFLRQGYTVRQVQISEPPN